MKDLHHSTMTDTEDSDNNSLNGVDKGEGELQLLNQMATFLCEQVALNYAFVNMGEWRGGAVQNQMI